MYVYVHKYIYNQVRDHQTTVTTRCTSSLAAKSGSVQVQVTQRLESGHPSAGLQPRRDAEASQLALFSVL
jgi:hypothetical protein